MVEFKIGDIVICKSSYDGNSKIIDQVGKIILKNGPHTSTVEFFNNIGGHDCSRKGKNGHCWGISETYLRLYAKNWRQVLEEQDEQV